MKSFKQMIPAILLVCTLLFCACGQQTAQVPNDTSALTTEPEPIGSSLWDGTVATAFAGGDGTAEDPYQIQSAEQFAFFAKRVNYTQGYQDKAYSLMCDVDLNHIDWLPVGNRTLPFSGSFFGNGHTVSNLNVTKGVSFETQYYFGTVSRYAMGLFGNCTNAVIRDLNISGAQIFVKTVPMWHDSAIGILAGSVGADTASEISGVKILDSEIITGFGQDESGGSLNIGGVIGEVTTVGDIAAFTAQRLQAEVHIYYQADRKSINTVGGLIGTMLPSQTVLISDCACYSTIELIVRKENSCWNDIGAIGSSIRFDGNIDINNVFSEITLNLDIDPSVESAPLYRTNAVIGSVYFYGNGGPDNPKQYRFKNLYGYVNQTSEYSDQAKSILSVCDSTCYVLSNHCIGCTRLPEDHSFDPDIWNLNDPEKPVLK